VSWELIEPGGTAPGPTLDHPDVVSVAIAATWPVGTRPLAIRVLYTGGPRREIKLGEPLAARIQAAAGDIPGSEIESGAFYLPRATSPDDPVGWIGNGWPAGAYTLEVETEDGLQLLPFTLGSDGA
jgi:hypothetical protein